MRYFILLFIAVLSIDLSGQMAVDGSTLYGNEWIDYDKAYVKVTINEDGIYRVSRQQLIDNGIPVNSISMDQLHMWNFGEEVSFYIAPDESYIEFYGERNRIKLDQFLYEDSKYIFNPEYSLVTDDAAYFITWTDEVNTLLIDNIVSDLTNNTLVPETFYLHHEKVIANSKYYKPVEDTEDVRYSSFVSSEGYGTGSGENNSIDIPISNLVNSTSEVQLNVRYGGNNYSHRTEIKVNDFTVGSFDSKRDTVQQLSLNIPIAQVGTENAKVTLTSVLSDSDKNTIANAELIYPRLFHSNGQEEFTIHLSASSIDRYIEVDGYNDSDSPILYNFNDNSRIIPTYIGGGKIGFIIGGNAGTVDEVVLMISTKDPNTNSAKGIEKREFINYENALANYLIVSSEKLSNQGNVDAVQEYANYRSSEFGGGYVPLIAHVEQLYDQFAYGVDRHSLAIRNYGYWAKEKYEDPKFMFIIGKSREYPEVRQDINLAMATDFYVPTWGNPGSDNLLLASFDSPVPFIPVGRLAARSSEDVMNYLQKVQDHEANRTNPSTIEEREWQKSVLHLSGGDGNIQENLFNSLEIMRDTLENNMYGANVKTFRKLSTDPIETVTSELIFDEIDSGVSIITFFGHASVGTFDFNLDNVENYNNRGKYPLIISLGCYSGNIHTTSGGISEKFVIEKDKGAMGFVAASGTAYIGVQKQFGRTFYSEAGGDSYGEPIGNILNKTVKKYENFRDYSYVTFYEQLTYHGDPAVRFPNFKSPDFTPDLATINTDPKFIDTYEDKFDVCFDVVNIGKAIQDSMDVLIQHYNPRNELEFETVKRVLTPKNRINLCVTIPISSRELVGKNTLVVKVDNGEEIEELPSPDAELNNILINQNGGNGFEFFILNNSAIPIKPEKYSIVNESNVSLISSTYNAMGEKQDFVMQIDTTTSFDSGLIRERTVEGAQGIVRWDLDFELIENTVYYWRISPDPLATGVGYVWDESSFLYATSEDDGWNQSHIYQLQESQYENIRYVGERQTFVNNIKEVRLDVSQLNTALDPPGRAKLFINGGFTDQWRAGMSKGLGILMFDPVTSESRRDMKMTTFGNVNNSNRNQFFWEFPTDTKEQRTTLLNFLTNEVADSFNVMVTTLFKVNQEYDFEAWANDSIGGGTNLFEYFKSQGAQMIDEWKERGTVPYTFVYQKDKNKVIKEDLAVQRTDDLSSIYQITSLWDRGNITSPLIGPAQSWDRLVWDWRLSDNGDNDTIYMEVIAPLESGVDSVLYSNIVSSNFDLSAINGEEYPYLRIKFYSKDEIDLSTAMLDMMRVHYTGRADIALDPSVAFDFHSATLDEGEELSLTMGVSNFTKSDFSASKITYSVVNAENVSQSYDEVTPPLKAGESKEVEFKLNTKGLTDVYTLSMNANPDRDPMEKYTFNNFGLSSFEVLPDEINPTMAVRFDGVHIFENDIISAEPIITIELNDENEYLLLEDPTLFVMSVTDPSGEQIQVSTSDPEVTFYPGEKENNTARIEYAPKFEIDGQYRLTVEAKDESNNASGSQQYDVGFRVFNDEMVSNVFNYPNPFSTSTQFIFTLTGNEEPGNILIRIMTLSGKVVREITAAELGQLRIGMNKTEFKWDGTDEFGERLGNGTYLYQVITKKLDGSDYDRFSDSTQNNTDYLFKEGFGKLVIMR